MNNPTPAIELTRDDKILAKWNAVSSFEMEDRNLFQSTEPDDTLDMLETMFNRALLYRLKADGRLSCKFCAMVEANWGADYLFTHLLYGRKFDEDDYTAYHEYFVERILVLFAAWDKQNPESHLAATNRMTEQARGNKSCQ